MPGLQGGSMTQSAPMPLIAAQHICVRFGGPEVLHDVSLRVDPGEIVTIVGPNGSGKSTLLRALLGILPLSSGQVTRAAGLRLGYVPQKLAIDRSMPMTVRRFLSLSADMYFYSGGAHGNSGFDALVWDREGQAFFDPKALFRSEAALQDALGWLTGHRPDLASNLDYYATWAGLSTAICAAVMLPNWAGVSAAWSVASSAASCVDDSAAI